MKNLFKIKCYAAVFLALLLFTAGCTWVNTEKSGAENKSEYKADGLELHFIDVGQGDCTLIKTGDTAILIDSGPGSSSLKLCEYLEGAGVEKIAAFIGTHPHEDHLGGAAAVFEAFDIGEIYLTDEPSTGYFYEHMLDVLDKNNYRITMPEFGCIYEFGGIRFQFISPKKDFGNTNDNSLVTLVTYKKARMLFMGDAEKAVEEELVKSGGDISAGVLKVGHHGSRNASTSLFLEKVSPVCAAVQCEKGNSYGHPQKEALDRLRKCGANILRCDISGSIVIKCDGKSFSDSSGNIFKVDEKQKEAVFYIANVKSRKYHTSSCKNLPKAENAKNFKTREEAENADFTPCKNCNP